MSDLNDHKHPTAGRCQVCYQRKRYKTDPALRQYYADYHKRPEVKARQKEIYHLRMQDPVYRERRAKMSLAWKQAHPETWKGKPQDRSAAANNHYRHAYGLTIQEVDKRISDRKGLCDICGNIASGNGPRVAKDGSRKPAKLHVDHDHKTNKTRGMLCFQCNKELGFLEKFLNKGWMEKATAYLNKYR